MTSSLESVCVYCGSNFGENAAHRAAARALGKALGDAGLRLVYGGGSVGLMGTVADATLEAGGSVIGIIPQFLADREVMHRGLTETLITADMHERKRLMFEHADAFVALPGGIGTLEELVEMMTWAQLGRHRKPVMAANFGGYWDHLLALLDHMRAQGFLPDGAGAGLLTAGAPEDVVPMLRKARAEALARDPEPAADRDAIERM